MLSDKERRDSPDTHRRQVFIQPRSRSLPRDRVSRKDAHRVKRWRKREHIVQRGRSMGWPVSEDSARAGRTAHGATCIAAHSIVKPGVRRKRSAGARRARASVLVAIPTRVIRRMIVDPIIRRGLAIRELRRLDFANDDRPAVYETLDSGCGLRLGREELVECTITSAGAETLDIEEVFDRPTRSSQRLLRRLGEAQPGRDRYGHRRCAVDMGRQLLETTIIAGHGSVQERLFFVVI